MGPIQGGRGWVVPEGVWTFWDPPFRMFLRQIHEILKWIPELVNCRLAPSLRKSG